MTLSVGSIPDVIAILPAAGIGRRMQIAMPKQYLTIGDKTLLEHAIDALLCQPCIREVIVAISSADCWYHQLPIAADRRVSVVTGGEARADSVMAALSFVRTAPWVLVHDAARPCLHQDDLRRLLAITAYTEVGGLLASPVRDTMKRARAGTDIIASTVERKDLWHALTPQLFARDLLKNCLERALAEGITMTDEASALEYYGYAPLLVRGRADNIKVTHSEDLALARFFFSQLANTESTQMRIGHGFDAHQFGGEGPLIIGGVRIPYLHGLLAYSDGDVALHAATDALLGAAALGDIGKLFPDTDLVYKGTNSRALLRKAWRQIVAKGYRLGNLDITLIVQAPEMAPHIPQMRVHIAEDLGCHLDDISVKATTTERLGFTGRGEGIACEAIALLVRTA